MSKREEFNKKREELLKHIRLIISKEREIGENHHMYQYPRETKLGEELVKLNYEQMIRECKIFQLFDELETISFS